MPRGRPAIERIKMGGFKPTCFASNEQWEEYKAAAARTPNSEAGHTYCSDCMPKFKDLMVACGRCPHSRVKFTIDSEGGVVGHRPT